MNVGGCFLDQFWSYIHCSYLSGYFEEKAMPSAGFIPFVQNFICTFNNTCHNSVWTEPGRIQQYNKSLWVLEKKNNKLGNILFYLASPNWSEIWKIHWRKTLIQKKKSKLWKMLFKIFCSWENFQQNFNPIKLHSLRTVDRNNFIFRH